MYHIRSHDTRPTFQCTAEGSRYFFATTKLGKKSKAPAVIWTRDLLITSQPLCQLSHWGAIWIWHCLGKKGGVQTSLSQVLNFHNTYHPFGGIIVSRLRYFHTGSSWPDGKVYMLFYLLQQFPCNKPQVFGSDYHQHMSNRPELHDWRNRPGCY